MPSSVQQSDVYTVKKQTSPGNKGANGSFPLQWPTFDDMVPDHAPYIEFSPSDSHKQLISFDISTPSKRTISSGRTCDTQLHDGEINTPNFKLSSEGLMKEFFISASSAPTEMPASAYDIQKDTGKPSPAIKNWKKNFIYPRPPEFTMEHRSDRLLSDSRSLSWSTGFEENTATDFSDNLSENELDWATSDIEELLEEWLKAASCKQTRTFEHLSPPCTVKTYKSNLHDKMKSSEDFASTDQQTPRISDSKGPKENKKCIFPCQSVTSSISQGKEPIGKAVTCNAVSSDIDTQEASSSDSDKDEIVEIIIPKADEEKKDLTVSNSSFVYQPLIEDVTPVKFCNSDVTNTNSEIPEVLPMNTDSSQGDYLSTSTAEPQGSTKEQQLAQKSCNEQELLDIANQHCNNSFTKDCSSQKSCSQNINSPQKLDKPKGQKKGTQKRKHTKTYHPYATRPNNGTMQTTLSILLPQCVTFQRTDTPVPSLFERRENYAISQTNHCVTQPASNASQIKSSNTQCDQNTFRQYCNNRQPECITSKPGYNTPRPGYNVLPSGYTTSQQRNSTSQPGPVLHPGYNTSQPSSNMIHPGNITSQRTYNTSQPNNITCQSGGNTSHSDINTSFPGNSASQQSYSASQSGYNTPQPNNLTPQSDYNTSQSGNSIPHPYNITSHPSHNTSHSGYSTSHLSNNINQSGYNTFQSGNNKLHPSNTTTQSRYNTPASGNSTSQPSYNTPQSGYSTPQSRYNTPHSHYNISQSSYITPQSGDDTPQSGYITSHPGHITPQTGYNTPQSGYNTPHPGFSTPQQGYNAPQSGYNTPQLGCNIPQSGYNTSQQVYNTPQSGYNTPKSVVKPPHFSYNFPRPCNNVCQLDCNTHPHAYIIPPPHLNIFHLRHNTTQPGYNDLRPGSSTPQQRFSTPQSIRNNSQIGYKTPRAGFSTPEPGYNTSHQCYKTSKSEDNTSQPGFSTSQLGCQTFQSLNNRPHPGCITSQQSYYTSHTSHNMTHPDFKTLQPNNKCSHPCYSNIQSNYNTVQTANNATQPSYSLTCLQYPTARPICNTVRQSDNIVQSGYTVQSVKDTSTSECVTTESNVHTSQLDDTHINLTAIPIISQETTSISSNHTIAPSNYTSTSLVNGTSSACSTNKSFEIPHDNTKITSNDTNVTQDEKATTVLHTNFSMNGNTNTAPKDILSAAIKAITSPDNTTAPENTIAATPNNISLDNTATTQTNSITTPDLNTVDDANTQLRHNTAQNVASQIVCDDQQANQSILHPDPNSALDNSNIQKPFHMMGYGKNSELLPSLETLPTSHVILTGSDLSGQKTPATSTDLLTPSQGPTQTSSVSPDQVLGDPVPDHVTGQNPDQVLNSDPNNTSGQLISNHINGQASSQVLASDKEVEILSCKQLYSSSTPVSSRRRKIIGHERKILPQRKSKSALNQGQLERRDVYFELNSSTTQPSHYIAQASRNFTPPNNTTTEAICNTIQPTCNTTQTRNMDTQPDFNTSQVKQNIAVWDQEKYKLNCLICYKKYVRWTSLKKHLLTHLRHEVTSCVVCDETFDEAEQLALHYVHQHSAEKKYSC